MASPLRCAGSCGKVGVQLDERGIAYLDFEGDLPIGKAYSFGADESTRQQWNKGLLKDEMFSYATTNEERRTLAFQCERLCSSVRSHNNVSLSVLTSCPASLSLSLSLSPSLSLSLYLYLKRTQIG